mmetsp:Transcript_66717/g.150708  ORF Transcript_66717/g.150708 Transcript_66717/m.150708 type:complete len:244 (+) Transcript_66717:160-891(+)
MGPDNECGVSSTKPAQCLVTVGSIQDRAGASPQYAGRPARGEVERGHAKGRLFRAQLATGVSSLFVVHQAPESRQRSREKPPPSRGARGRVRRPEGRIPPPRPGPPGRSPEPPARPPRQRRRTPCPRATPAPPPPPPPSSRPAPLRPGRTAGSPRRRNRRERRRNLCTAAACARRPCACTRFGRGTCGGGPSGAAGRSERPTPRAGARRAPGGAAPGGSRAAAATRGRGRGSRGPARPRKRAA